MSEAGQDVTELVEASEPVAEVDETVVSEVELDEVEVQGESDSGDVPVGDESDDDSDDSTKSRTMTPMRSQAMRMTPTVATTRPAVRPRVGRVVRGRGPAWLCSSVRAR
jgi:hypothetical protein